MAVLHPWLLALLALVPLVWLTRPRRPRHRVVVGTSFLWNAVAATTTAPDRWRFANDLITWLRAGLVAALVLGIAGLAVDRTPDVYGVVVDTSLSMGARRTDGRTRLDEARDRARAILEGLPRGAEARLWTSGGAPVLVAVGTTGDVARALDALEPSAAAADLDAAAALAAQDRPRRIYVLSDAPVPVRRPDVEWLPVGAPAENVALLDLVLTRSAPASLDVTATTTVVNFTTSARDVPLEFRVGSRVIAARHVALKPGAALTSSVQVALQTAADTVSARVDTGDALPADDERTVVLAEPRRVRVALEGDNEYLAAVLDADAFVERVGSPATADVVLCAPCAATPEGPALVVAPSDRERSGPVPIVTLEEDHPVLADAPLDGLQVVPGAFDGVLRGDPDATDVTLATAGSQPVVIARTVRGSPQRVTLAFDASDRAVVGQPGFPLLVANAVAWLGGVERPAMRLRSTHEESNLLAALPPPVVPPAGGASRGVSARVDLGSAFFGVALLCLLGEMWVSWTRGSLPAGVRRPLVVRAAVAALIVAALIGVRLPTGEMPLALALVVDRSDSAVGWAGMFEAAAARTTAALREDDAVGLTVFGGDARVERRVQPGRLTGLTAAATVTGGSTDIERALQAARTSLPAEGDRRLLLMTDGHETKGDARREASRAAADGVRIDVIAPHLAGPPPAAVRRVTAPAVVREGEPFAVGVTAEGAPGVRGTMRLTGGTRLLEMPLTIPASGTAVLEVAMRADTAGLRTYRAAFIPDDTAGIPGWDATAVERGVSVAVAGRTRVLVVSPRPARVSALFGGVVEVVHASLADLRARRLETMDAVVLDEVDLGALSADVRGRLVRYVEDGGGLLVLADDASLPVGSTGDTAFDALLPVDPRPRGGIRGSSLALVVVFDKSGSMDDRVGGTRKIEFARRAVRDVADALPAGDALGVVAFDGAPTVVRPLGPRPSPAVLDDALAALRPAGATAVAPALDAAFRMLETREGTGAARRHVLLVTDGQTSADDIAALRRRVADAAIAVSIVAVAAGPERPALAAIAASSGGRAYFPDDVRELPRTVTRETARVAGGRTVETPFDARLLPHSLTRDLDGAPRLGGYVVTAARPLADVLIGSPLGDPVAAIGRAGTGRVAVYTAALHSPWSAGLERWPDAGAFFSRLTRWLTRRVDDAGVTMTARAVGAALAVEVDGPTSDAGLSIRGTVRAPDGARTPFLLDAASSSRFQAMVPVNVSGAYEVTVEWEGPAAPARALTRGVFWSAPAERQGTESDRARLAEVAALTGGRVLNPTDDAMGPRRAGTTDGRPWLAALALALAVAEMAGPGLVEQIRRIRRRTSAGRWKEQHA